MNLTCNYSRVASPLPASVEELLRALAMVAEFHGGDLGFDRYDKSHHAAWFSWGFDGAFPRDELSNEQLVEVMTDFNKVAEDNGWILSYDAEDQGLGIFAAIPNDENYNALPNLQSLQG